MGNSISQKYSFSSQYAITESKNKDSGLYGLQHFSTRQPFLGRQLTCNDEQQTYELECIIEQKIRNPSPFVTRLLKSEAQYSNSYCSETNTFYLLYNAIPRTLSQEIQQRKEQNRNFTLAQIDTTIVNVAKGLKYLYNINHHHNLVSPSAITWPIQSTDSIRLIDEWIIPVDSFQLRSKTLRPKDNEEIREKNIQLSMDLYNLGLIGNQMISMSGNRNLRGQPGYSGVVRKLEVLASALHVDKSVIYGIIDAKDSVRGIKSRVIGATTHHNFQNVSHIMNYEKPRTQINPHLQINSNSTVINQLNNQQLINNSHFIKKHDVPVRDSSLNKVSFHANNNHISQPKTNHNRNKSVGKVTFNSSQNQSVYAISPVTHVTNNNTHGNFYSNKISTQQPLPNPQLSHGIISTDSRSKPLINFGSKPSLNSQIPPTAPTSTPLTTLPISAPFTVNPSVPISLSYPVTFTAPFLNSNSNKQSLTQGSSSYNGLSYSFGQIQSVENTLYKGNHSNERNSGDYGLYTSPEFFSKLQNNSLTSNNQPISLSINESSSINSSVTSGHPLASALLHSSDIPIISSIQSQAPQQQISSQIPTSPATHPELAPTITIHENIQQTPAKQANSHNPFSTIPEVSERSQSVKSDDEKDFIIEQYENGSRYEGFKVNGYRNGKGKFYYQEGSFYDGEWKNNNMHGYGKLYYSNHRLAYEGDWFIDQFHGHGKVYNDQPVAISGNFDFTDFGNLGQQWKYYEGDLVCDAKEGNGRLVLSNGQYYEGQFKNDKVDGKGKFVARNGEVINGLWKESRFVKKF